MEAAEGSQPAKPRRVKYDGPCDRRGATLLRGDVAVYDRSSKTIRHVECPTEPPIDFGVAGASAQRECERRLAKDKARREAKRGWRWTFS